jgi:hypothetical protein
MTEKIETYAAARGSDPLTSQLAALRAGKSKLEKIVYDCLLLHRGRYMTTMDVCKETGLHQWSVSPRFKPLWVKGLLKDPIRVAGLNSAGRIRPLNAWTVK